MAISDSQILELASGQSMAADFFSGVFECGGFDSGSLAMSWTGANRTTALLMPQFSIDAVKWSNYVGEESAQVVDSPDGCKMYSFTDMTFPYMRFSFVKKSNTAGVITVKVYAKRHFGRNA